MKILLIQLTGRGGIQLYTACLANALVKTEDVYVLIGDNLIKKNYYNDNVKLIPIQSPISYYKMILLSLNPLTYYRIIKIINNLNPDIIHVTYEFLWDSIALQFLKKYPIIFTDHDPNQHVGTKAIVRLYIGISNKLIKNISNKIIVHGNILKKNLIEKGISESKIQVIHLGDFSFYNKWQDSSLIETKSILFFGMIRDYKGLEYLIQAEPIITSSVPDTKIIIAGSGDFKKYDNLIINRKSFEIINRYIADEEVANLFQKCSVVVLPYIEASQSGVISIAYAFKKPVVTTNVGSIPEIVDDGITGFIVQPKDTLALSNAIIKLLQDEKLRKTLGENAYKKATIELSWNNICKKIIALYKDIIHNADS